MAEGEANLSSALASGAIGVLGLKLDAAGCGVFCQNVTTFIPTVATTTVIDKSIEKVKNSKSSSENKVKVEQPNCDIYCQNLNKFSQLKPR